MASDTPTDAARATAREILDLVDFPYCPHAGPDANGPGQHQAFADDCEECIAEVLTRHRDARVAGLERERDELRGEMGRLLQSTTANGLREEGRREGLREAWARWCRTDEGVAAFRDWLERAAEGSDNG